MDNSVGHPQFDWRKPLAAVVVAAVVSLLITVFGSDVDWLLYTLAVVLLGGFVSLLTIAIQALRKRRRQSFMVLAVFGAYVVVTAVFFMNSGRIRPTLRWMLSSQRFKSEVLAQVPKSGEFQHIEWDGWGGTPVGDWTAYVVFDPTDSLLPAAKERWSGADKRYKGIPCEVESIRQLESRWYSVVLGMNQWWEQCNSSNKS